MERIGLQGWDEILRYAQDDRRGKRVRRGRWVFGERGLRLETGRGQAVEPEPDRSERPATTCRTNSAPVGGNEVCGDGADCWAGVCD